MDTLHLDWNPYLVELGVEKRAAEYPLETVYHATRATRKPIAESYPPVVLPYDAVTNITSQYQAIRSIVSKLKFLCFLTSQAIPDDEFPFTAEIDGLGAERISWWDRYTREILEVRWCIDQYMGSSGFDNAGKYFRTEFGVIRGMILELVPAHGVLPHSDQLKLMQHAVSNLASMCLLLPSA